jgi:sugar lactone lactonase YvrE
MLRGSPGTGSTRSRRVDGGAAGLLMVALSSALLACGGSGDDGAAQPKHTDAASVDVVAPGAITTIAGGGRRHGDRGPATKAQFCGPGDATLDSAGNMYIADGGAYCNGPGGNTVRKIDADGVITTVAGSGSPGFSGDGGPATSAELNLPVAVAVDRKGNLYITDWNNYRIRKVDTKGTITTIAGTGEKGYSGDGGPARKAGLADPGGLAFDARGNLYVADHVAIRRIDRSGTIKTVAGNGKEGFSGTGGRATDAKMTSSDVAFDRRGNMYFSDTLHDRVRMVDADGMMRPVAGSGELAPLGDGGPATAAALNFPVGVAVDGKGNVFIAEHHGDRVRKVDPDGTITTVAGTGESGFSGDRGPATKVKLNQPWGLLLGEPGLLYIADAFNARVRAVRYEDSEG